MKGVDLPPLEMLLEQALDIGAYLRRVENGRIVLRFHRARYEALAEALRGEKPILERLIPGFGVEEADWREFLEVARRAGGEKLALAERGGAVLEVHVLPLDEFPFRVRGSGKDLLERLFGLLGGVAFYEATLVVRDEVILHHRTPFYYGELAPLEEVKARYGEATAALLAAWRRDPRPPRPGLRFRQRLLI